ncbi:MAG: small multi-drug export protein [Clostridia bacterium]|nr:small multi-drug export protein [Clostridia bacterium]
MVPIIELRGAIPVAILLHDLHPVLAFACSVLGNIIPVPFIIIFIRKIFSWIRKRIPKLNRMIDRLEEKGKSKKDTVEKLGFWGLFVFVAIPLPGTGAWTGALIAAMMDMRLKRAFPSILLGVITAGIVVTVLVSVGLAAYIGFSAS